MEAPKCGADGDKPVMGEQEKKGGDGFAAQQCLNVGKQHVMIENAGLVVVQLRALLKGEVTVVAVVAVLLEESCRCPIPA